MITKLSPKANLFYAFLLTISTLNSPLPPIQPINFTAPNLTNEQHTVAFVRTDPALNHLEARFIAQHTNYRTQKLAEFLAHAYQDQISLAVCSNLATKNQSTSKPDLKIALCLSGGGYRAMIYSLGVLLGAEKIKLLPAVSYISCLSGSTWSIGAYLTSSHTLSALRAHFKTITQNSLYQFYRLDQLFQHYWQHKLHHQTSNLVLLWSSLLANQVLDHITPHKFAVRLSEQQYFAQHYAHLIPIYTAIVPSLIPIAATHPAQQAKHSYNYNWLEFTPYEISYITKLGAIPSWALGRQFNQGVSQNFTPELPFAYLLGIFGSAFTANLTEIYREPQPLITIPVIDFKQPHLNYLKYLPHLRLAPAQLPNFSFGLNLAPTYTSRRLWGLEQIKTQINARLQHLAHQQNTLGQKFSLLDAGIDFNLPLPPLLKPNRQLDVIIICDISSGLPARTELTKALDYAREKFGLVYEPDPVVTSGYTPTVYYCQNQPLAPVILYLPAKYPKLPVYKTTNFNYSAQDFERLCDLGEADMIRHAGVIQHVLNERLRHL